jgi:hypothetical protein
MENSFVPIVLLFAALATGGLIVGLGRGRLEPFKMIGWNSFPRGFASRNGGVTASAQLYQGKTPNDSGGRPTVLSASNRRFGREHNDQSYESRYCVVTRGRPWGLSLALLPLLLFVRPKLGRSRWSGALRPG